jgi:hypothetical protein
MTTHTFDLAAALVDQAVDRLNNHDYGITRILFHDFGNCIFNANHTRHDTGHTVQMWAYDEHGVLAAAEAHAPHIGVTTGSRIVTFRAGHLTFNTYDTPAGFFARGQTGYALTPVMGSAEWDLAIGDDDHPQRFATLDDALEHILTDLEPAA